MFAPVAKEALPSKRAYIARGEQAELQRVRPRVLRYLGNVAIDDQQGAIPCPSQSTWLSVRA